MNKPKCPHCETSEYVVLVKKAEEVSTIAGAGVGAAGAAMSKTAGEETEKIVRATIGGAVGAVAGAAINGIMTILGGAATGAVIGNEIGERIDKSRSLYMCNKCGREFKG